MAKLKTMFLFDVDGTLTEPRQRITSEMVELLHRLKTKASVGVIGGSDLCKLEEQMVPCPVLTMFDYVFPENGLVAFKDGECIAKQNFVSFVTEEKFQKLVNFCLHYIGDLDIPIKRGTFLECRTGLLNVSPIGRNCTVDERNEFEEYDQVHHVRKTFIEVLKNEFSKYHLQYSIGGQISFDVFPVGWDKTYCLQFLEKENFDALYFFGDKYTPGGNDYELIVHPNVKGIPVNRPQETMSEVLRLLETL